MSAKPPSDWDITPVLPWLAALGVEMDQRLSQAWVRASMHPTCDHATGPCITDDMLIAKLLRLNPSCARLSNVSKFLERYSSTPDNQGWGSPAPPEEVYALGMHLEFFGPLAAEVAIDRTLTTGTYVKWIIDQCIASDPIVRPGLADAMAELFHGDWNANINTPQCRQFLDELASLAREPDDFQYIMAFEHDRISFRIVSVLDDFEQLNEDGERVAVRALITHFGRIGLFTPEEIADLEGLINSDARESVFQEFFEAHPHFLRHWDYRAVHPQVYLESEGHRPLVPDFILTNPDIQAATILDLKRPSPKLIRHQRNRDRFAAAVMEARSQLLTYRRFFEDPASRRKMCDKLKMEVYHPRLAVIIGRSSEFVSPLQRQQMAAGTPEIEIVTYDDILQYANRRRAIIEG